MRSKATLDAWRARCDAFLDASLAAASEPPETLHAAMRYAVLGEGHAERALLHFVFGRNRATVGDRKSVCRERV